MQPRLSIIERVYKLVSLARVAPGPFATFTRRHSGAGCRSSPGNALRPRRGVGSPLFLTITAAFPNRVPLSLLSADIGDARGDERTHYPAYTLGPARRVEWLELANRRGIAWPFEAPQGVVDAALS
ncbi:hypothetical protein MTO96_051057 [Rhipicephalus appendiculatus]